MSERGPIWAEETSAAMGESTRMWTRMISRLLQYPDEELLGSLPQFREVIEETGGASTRGPGESILAYFEQTPLLQLQEHYVEAFDLNPSNCLNLTYHRWKDSEKRGPALARLEELYRKAGYERIDNELPDYLPLVLEFITESGGPGCSEILSLYGRTVAVLAGRLREAGCPYGMLFEHLVRILDLADRETAVTG